MSNAVKNTRVSALTSLDSPELLHAETPITETIQWLVSEARQAAAAIMRGEEDRLLVLVGPCSIHDPKAALEYAERLKAEADRHHDDLVIIMRVYFEKPRTTVGWKGLINDPEMNDSFDIQSGLRMARQLLSDLSAMGMPAGTEFLDAITPQFIGDLVSWSAIGARTTESQVHRQLASGLSMPIGFKNGTNGDVQIAIDAVKAVQHPHHFLGITEKGSAAIVSTTGNDEAHIILRGSRAGTNYASASISEAVAGLEKAGLPGFLMIDCSHGNSCKQYALQVEAARSLCAQMMSGSKKIAGVMVESHLKEGRQDLQAHQPLEYGQSVTDACIGWECTVSLLEELAAAVRKRRLVSA